MLSNALLVTTVGTADVRDIGRCKEKKDDTLISGNARVSFSLAIGRIANPYRPG